jgi:hypothetical protein
LRDPVKLSHAVLQRKCRAAPIVCRAVRVG